MVWWGRLVKPSGGATKTLLKAINSQDVSYIIDKDMHLRGLKQETPAVVKSDRCDIVMYCGIISSELLLQTRILTKLNLSFIAAEFFLFSTYHNAYTYN